MLTGDTPKRTRRTDRANLGAPVSGQKGTRPMRRRTATAAAALAALLTLTTACGDDEPAANEPTPTQTPSPTETTSTPASPEDQAVEDATAALDRYFKVTNKARTNPSIPLERLDTVAISTGLTNTQAEFMGYRRTPNVIRTGDTTYELQKVLDISLDNSNPKKGIAPTVQLQVCWDLSAATAVDKNGTSQVNPDRLDRSIATYFVSNYEYKTNPRDGWKVSSVQTKMEKPC